MATRFVQVKRESFSAEVGSLLTTVRGHLRRRIDTASPDLGLKLEACVLARGHSMPGSHSLRRFALALSMAWIAHVAPSNAAAGPLVLSEPMPLPSGASGIEAAQWVDGASIGMQAERIISTKQNGVMLQDEHGNVWASLPGSYGAMDHRSGGKGLLLAIFDAVQQQAVVHFLPAESRVWREAVAVPKPEFGIEGLCLYEDGSRHAFLFVLGEEGRAEQWLVADDKQPLSKPRLVRRLSMLPDSEYCQVDDVKGQVLVNEASAGFWSYPAGDEAPLERQVVDIVRPYGQIDETAGGLALVPGGLLALDPDAAMLHLYRQRDGDWAHQGALSLASLAEPEGISVRSAGEGKWDVLLRDDEGLHTAVLNWQLPASPTVAAIPVLPAAAQTESVPSWGDAADDPAIWLHPRRPQESRILGTDKRGGLVVYDLAGRTVQNLRVGRQNNVDVRSGFLLGDQQVDLAVSTNRDHNSLHAFAIDRDSGLLTEIGQVATPLSEIYGLCLFKDREGDIHAIANDKNGTFLQYRLHGGRGKVEGELVRQFGVPTQPEGCVADDRNERLFIGEEDVAVWALDARPTLPAMLEKVIAVGDVVHDDIEGLALYQGKARNYLIISSQGNDSFVIVDAEPPYHQRGVFRIGLNPGAGIDGVSETDGVEVTSADLGGIWQAGMLIVQDGRKRMPEGRQNFKMLPWADIARTFNLE